MEDGRNLYQHMVARGMAKGVVHLLEAIEVDVQDHAGRVLPGRIVAQVLQRLLQPVAVWQAGHRIVIGDLLDFSVRAFEPARGVLGLLARGFQIFLLGNQIVDIGGQSGCCAAVQTVLVHLDMADRGVTSGHRFPGALPLQGNEPVQLSLDLVGRNAERNLITHQVTVVQVTGLGFGPAFRKGFGVVAFVAQVPGNQAVLLIVDCKMYGALADRFAQDLPFPEHPFKKNGIVQHLFPGYIHVRRPPAMGKTLADNL